MRYTFTRGIPLHTRPGQGAARYPEARRGPADRPCAGGGRSGGEGRAKIEGLLEAEEAVPLQLVAGARNHRNRLALPSRWISSDL